MNDYNPEHRAGDDNEPVIGDPPPRSDVLLSNSVYDKLMPIAQIYLPALAVFYITVAPLWGLPKQEEVAGTIMALNLLLGAVLGVSNKQYQNSEERFDGEVQVERLPEGDAVTNLLFDSSALVGKDEVLVKVNRV